MNMKYNNMNKAYQQNLSKDEFIKIILKKQNKKPIPAPRKNVKEMVKQYGDNNIKPIPAVRTKNQFQLQNQGGIIFLNLMMIFFNQETQV